MSDTAASLRRKIVGAGDLQSVVRTMKALATANIAQYEQQARGAGRLILKGLKMRYPATSAKRRGELMTIRERLLKEVTADTR